MKRRAQPLELCKQWDDNGCREWNSGSAGGVGTRLFVGERTFATSKGPFNGADLNRDGIVSLQELYEYVEQQVTWK